MFGISIYDLTSLDPTQSCQVQGALGQYKEESF